MSGGERPVPGPDTRKLGALVGNWRTEGEVLVEGSDAVLQITGSDVYEWLGGGFFLVHHVDVLVGAEHVQAIEIIGSYDPTRDVYLARSFDNRGAAEMMEVRVSARGVWTFTGGPGVAQAAQPDGPGATERVRSTLEVSSDGTSMRARWERAPAGRDWLPWMDVRFTKRS
jgi:Protein of unknown function (DUF1579)